MDKVIMERIEIIEKVAAGLRKMDITPDYILFDNESLQTIVWGEDTICGIPVLHTYLVRPNRGYSDHYYPFQPLFKKDIDLQNQTYLFQRGYYECPQFHIH